MESHPHLHTLLSPSSLLSSLPSSSLLLSPVQSPLLSSPRDKEEGAEEVMTSPTSHIRSPSFPSLSSLSPIASPLSPTMSPLPSPKRFARSKSQQQTKEGRRPSLPLNVPIKLKKKQSNDIQESQLGDRSANLKCPRANETENSPRQSNHLLEESVEEKKCDADSSLFGTSCTVSSSAPTRTPLSNSPRPLLASSPRPLFQSSSRSLSPSSSISRPGFMPSKSIEIGDLKMKIAKEEKVSFSPRNEISLSPTESRLPSDGNFVRFQDRSIQPEEHDLMLSPESLGKEAGGETTQSAVAADVLQYFFDTFDAFDIMTQFIQNHEMRKENLLLFLVEGNHFVIFFTLIYIYIYLFSRFKHMGYTRKWRYSLVVPPFFCLFSLPLSISLENFSSFLVFRFT